MSFVCDSLVSSVWGKGWIEVDKDFEQLLVCVWFPDFPSFVLLYV